MKNFIQKKYNLSRVFLFFFVFLICKGKKINDLIIPGYDTNDKLRQELENSTIYKNQDSDESWFLYKSVLSRKARIKSGEELFELLERDKVTKIKSLHVISYGAEVMAAFLKKNKEADDPIQIENITMVASPVTHWLVDSIRDNNLFEDENINNVFFVFSNRDRTQILDVTQSLSFKDGFRFFYAIRHDLPLDLSKKIININVGSNFKTTPKDQVHGLIIDRYFRSSSFKKKIHSANCLNSDERNFYLGQNDQLLPIKNKKKYLRWKYFGIFEKLIFGGMIFAAFYKSINYIKKFFMNTTNSMDTTDMSKKL